MCATLKTESIRCVGPIPIARNNRLDVAQSGKSAWPGTRKSLVQIQPSRPLTLNKGGRIMGSLFKRGSSIPKVKKQKTTKSDEAAMRTRYSAYRKRMAKSPSTVTKTKPYAQWKKTQ